MRTRADILTRVFSPRRDELTPELAKQIVSLDFRPEDHARYLVLSSKAQAGTLAKCEVAELDEYLSVNSLLMVLQSKARDLLRKKYRAAPRHVANR